VVNSGRATISQLRSGGNNCIFRVTACEQCAASLLGPLPGFVPTTCRAEGGGGGGKRSSGDERRGESMRGRWKRGNDQEMRDERGGGGVERTRGEGK